MYVFAILAQLADLTSSIWGFNNGAVELNPLGQTPLGLIALKLLAIAVIVSVLYLSGRLGGRWTFPVVAVAVSVVSVFAYIAAWNNLT